MPKTFQEINKEWEAGELCGGEVVQLYMELVTPDNFLEALELMPERPYECFVEWGHAYYCGPEENPNDRITVGKGSIPKEFHPELNTLLGKYLGYVFEE